MKKMKLDNVDIEFSNGDREENEEENDSFENEEESNYLENEEGINIDKDKEREFYERAFIDFYRLKYPSPVDFINYVCNTFQRENYQIKDSMSLLSKDAKCCLINYLSVFDICRLGRTCKTYKEVIDSSKYNEYWRTRFRLKFPLAYVEKNGIYKYRGKPKEMLWFDIYQYSVFFTSLGAFHGKRKQLLLNKQSLSTFVRGKRNTLPGVCKLNVYFRGDWKLAECLRKEFEFIIPKDIVSLMGLSTDKWTAKKFEQSWTEFCLTNYLKIKTDEDLMNYKKLLSNDYYSRRGCLFDIPDSFKNQWKIPSITNFNTRANSNCMCPYDSRIRSYITVDNLKKGCSECPIFYIRQTSIYDPLRIEARKYGVNY